MFKKKISLSFAIILMVAGIGISYFLMIKIGRKAPVEAVSDNAVMNCTYNLTRLGGYEFIRPLLFSEEECESQKLIPIKNELQSLISGYKNSGVITNASVYIRKLEQGEWISIGEGEQYYPGSLLKVPELITFMKMNERSPGLLDKKITYSTALNLPKQAIYVSKSIEVGKTYSIRELIYYMIAYSDNYATMLLNQQMDVNIFKKVFIDLGIPEPDLTKKDIPITAKNYSYFMRALFNASYLSIDDSEYCTELLSHSDFTGGMLNSLPRDIKVVHKFGEAGDGIDAHFNESGIIYINKSPYLITIMTKGKRNNDLPPIVSMISKKVFDMISST
ncbi:MAG: serine hydrolase [Ferruginibacter sp.]